MKNIIDRKHLEKALTYEDYRDHIDELLAQGKVTGPQQSESLAEYTKLNVARMRRIDKTIEILPDVQQVITSIKKPQTWIVITEGWCGDAAQIVPVFNALARLNNKIILKLVLRDDNLELMDQYLTHGRSRSIPKLIVTDSDTLQELFNWGARPKALQDKVDEMKANKVSFDEIKEMLHGWYAKDKTFTTQKELAEMFVTTT
jgi:precorrin-6B methylase 2